MSQTFEDWFGQYLPQPGVAAWAVRLPDRTLTSFCYSDWLSVAQIEETLTRLVLAADGLGHHGMHPERLSWVFEHARICLSRRGDGAWLALFMENRQGVLGEQVARALDDFSGRQEA